MDTGNTAGLNEQMILDSDVWEDVPMDQAISGQETQVDPSHEGGDYFHFVEMVEASFSRYFIFTPKPH